MSSSAKKRQTMAKMTRERTLREKRELKQQKKDERKRAIALAAAGESPETADQPLSDPALPEPLV